MSQFKWVVEFTVDEVWVADGFNLTKLRALEMLASDLDMACMDTEIAAKIIRKPADDKILRAQGYDPKSLDSSRKASLLAE